MCRERYIKRTQNVPIVSLYGSFEICVILFHNLLTSWFLITHWKNTYHMQQSTVPMRHWCYKCWENRTFHQEFHPDLVGPADLAAQCAGRYSTLKHRVLQKHTATVGQDRTDEEMFGQTNVYYHENKVGYNLWNQGDNYQWQSLSYEFILAIQSNKG